MKIAALGDVVDFYSGGTPSKANTEFWAGDVPWFSAKDVKQARLVDSIDHISESVFRSTSLRRLPAGTVVMVVRGMILVHTVPISILEVPAAINQDLKALLPKGGIDTRFCVAPLLVIGRQVRTPHGKFIDRLAIDADGNLHVLELKRDKTPRDGVAQALDYGSWVTTLTRKQVIDVASGHLRVPSRRPSRACSALPRPTSSMPHSSSPSSPQISTGHPNAS